MIKLKEIVDFSHLNEMPHTHYGDVPVDLHFEKYIKSKADYLKYYNAFWEEKLCGYSTKHNVYMLITPQKLKKLDFKKGTLPSDYVELPDDWEKYIKFVL